jgi:nicotinamidase-related amidase
MTALTLDAATTALVVIDLQQGIVAMPTVPRSGSEVLAQSVRLAKRFRERGGLVVLVQVDPGPNGELFPRPITDVQRPAMQMAPGWADLAPALGPQSGDAVVTKHQPGAFYGTDLDLRLRRRGVQTIVICGISTDIGVEATARVAYEHGYNLVFVEDAMAGRDAAVHAACVSKFFPTIGRVRSTDEVVAAL